MKFTKKDLMVCLITGFYAGIIAWGVLTFLGSSSVIGVPTFLFVLIIPIVWIVGVNFGYFLGKWMTFFNQFGRFTVIGFTNFIVYTGILNIFLWLTGITSGIWYSVFVAVAFIGGALHSYGWNKFWVFESSTDGGAGQFLKFFVVNGVGGLINVGIASFLVNVIGPQFGISPEGWANIGGVVGSGVALIFSFIAFRLVVFKKK